MVKTIVYNAVDIAKYVVDYSYDNHRLINLLRLHKIMYFIQCEYLANQDRPCFKEDFYAWPSGAILHELRYEYRQFGGLMTIFSTGTSNKKYNIRLADMKIIQEVIEQCELYSTSQLMDICRNQDPWINARQKSDNKITKESIIDFFNKE